MLRLGAAAAIIAAAAVGVVLALVATGAGCANNKQAASEAAPLNDSVADIDVAPVPPREPEFAEAAPLDVLAPDAPAPMPEPVSTPAPEAPVVSEAPAAQQPGSGEGTTYTVKKGDTLFSIARAVYGNGGQWQRIANANPGLSPSTLKAGTTIAIP